MKTQQSINILRRPANWCGLLCTAILALAPAVRADLTDPSFETSTLAAGTPTAGQTFGQWKAAAVKSGASWSIGSAYANAGTKSLSISTTSTGSTGDEADSVDTVTAPASGTYYVHVGGYVYNREPPALVRGLILAISLMVVLIPLSPQLPRVRLGPGLRPAAPLL